MKPSALLHASLAAVALAPLARCNSPSACVTDADCAKGLSCGYSIAQGCSALGQCVSATGACKQVGACGCDGSRQSVLCSSGYATAPVRSVGSCAPNDAGIDQLVTRCASGLECELCDVRAYDPLIMSTPRVMTSACSPAQLSGFTAACFAPNATQQTCSAWQTAAVDAGPDVCFDCLFSLQSSAAWSALVCTSNTCDINIPGCVDLVLGEQSLERIASGSGSCGDLLGDSYGCQSYACATCSTSGTPGQTDFAKCVTAAAANECKAFTAAVDSASGPCAPLIGDAAPAGTSRCFPQSSVDVPSFLDVFCGAGP